MRRDVNFDNDAKSGSLMTVTLPNRLALRVTMLLLSRLSGDNNAAKSDTPVTVTLPNRLPLRVTMLLLLLSRFALVTPTQPSRAHRRQVMPLSFDSLFSTSESVIVDQRCVDDCHNSEN
jgi:hypothetical protein